MQNEIELYMLKLLHFWNFTSNMEYQGSSSAFSKTLSLKDINKSCFITAVAFIVSLFQTEDTWTYSDGL